MSDLSVFIKDYGGAALAEELGVSRQLVSFWRTGRQRPSPEMARELERVSRGRLKRGELRPDIFGPLNKRSRQHNDLKPH